MEAFLQGVEASAIAQTLRFSRWHYAAVNALHIFGIALLIGSIFSFDVSLLRRNPPIDHRDLAKLLLPIAAIGLSIAVITGMLLFSVRATGYAALDVFRAKVLIVSFGMLAAIFAHLRYGWFLQNVRSGQFRLVALVSLLGWSAALITGRLIAFVDY